MLKLNAPNRTVRLLFLISSALLFNNCQNNSTVPFPSGETEFQPVLTKPLKLTDPEEITWKIKDPDSVRTLPSKPFYLDKLPSKPFDIGGPMPLAASKTKKFDWNSLPVIPFDVSKLPTQKLKFKTVLMSPPKKIKAGIPLAMPGSSRGILDAGSGLKLPGNGQCSMLDHADFLWVGTAKGLCRYDGANLELYDKDLGLWDDNVTAVKEDKNNNLWIGTNNGEIFVLDRKAGLMHHVIQTFPVGAILDLIIDRDGDIWVVQNTKGVFLINPNDETLKQFSEEEGLAQNFTVEIFQDKEGLIWITTRKGLNIIDKKAKTNRNLSKENGLSSNSVYAVTQDDDGDIWAGGNLLNVISRKKGTITEVGKPKGEGGAVLELNQHSSGQIFIGTTVGVGYYIPKNLSTSEKITITPGDGNFIIGSIEDKEGQVWFATQKGGYYLLNTRYGRPAHLTMEDGLPSNSVWGSLEDDNGNIWLATYNGVVVYNQQTKSFKHIGQEQGLVGKRTSHVYKDRAGRIWVTGNVAGVNIIDPIGNTIKSITPAQKLFSKGISVLMEDREGQMWMATENGEIFLYDLRKKLFKQITNLEDWEDFFVDTIVQDSTGQIWISSIYGGVVIIDPKANTIQRLSTAQGLSATLAASLMEDHDHNMWIGTEKGIDIVNPARDSITTLTAKQGLVNDAVWTLNEHNNKVYVGTSAGLAIITRTPSSDGKSLKWNLASLGKANGLTHLDFAENSTVITRQGQFWGGVDDQVLVVIDEPATDTAVIRPQVTGIHILDQPQSFMSRPTLEKSLEKIDTLWNVSTASFNTSKQILSDLNLNKSGIKWDSVESNYHLPANLRLPYDQNYLTFSYSSRTLANPDQVKYRYILEGIDKTWSPVTESSVSENYRDLPSGDYNFKVASKGMNGIWSSPAEFKFSIAPAWWRSLWAYLVYLLLFVVAVRAYISARSKTLKRQNQILEDRVVSRTNALQKSLDDLQGTQRQLIQSEKMASLGELTAGIAHEIQNPLNFVNNFSEINKELIEEMNQEIEAGNLKEVKAIALNISENEQKIIFHGKRADAIVKGMLQHSRTSTGQKEPTDINALSDEYLRLAYHGLRAKDKTFNASMKTDFDPTLGKVNVVPQDLGRVILNLITNAFYVVAERKADKAPGEELYEPTVSVSTRRNGSTVEIRVSDNGKGIPPAILDKIFQPFFTTKPSGKGTGLGLSMSYEIVTKGHGGELLVETKEGEGTTFVIKIPN